MNFDFLLRNGIIIDGTGQPRNKQDVGIIKDRIHTIGDLSKDSADVEIDASNQVVAPGFINMLSWAPFTFVEDGRSLSDITQGVTLEVFGEGFSMGPVNEFIKNNPPLSSFEFKWDTLHGYLKFIEKKGVSPNVASFVGATNLIIIEVGLDDRDPTSEELQNMRNLLDAEMKSGALGLGTALIYPPATFSNTNELIELSKIVAKYHGLYISHLRSEGNKLLEGIDEIIEIAVKSGVRVEIHHLKAFMSPNWHKMALAIQKIEQARKSGLSISANIYPYTAGGTGLTACLPPWVQEGGFQEFIKRLQDETLKNQIIMNMKENSDAWENFNMVGGVKYHP